MTRGLIVAAQFLTRLPMPRVKDLGADDLSRSAVWFPLIGFAVGTIVAAVLQLGLQIDARLAALLAWIAWIVVTGALHLDGLADLADALGAAHRDRSRFLEVLRDPHIGTFGVVAVIVASMSKLVLLGLATQDQIVAWFALPLIAGWARLGAVAWSRFLPALDAGSAQRLARHTSKSLIVTWSVALTAASVLLAPILALAPVALWAWGAYLKRRIGGVTGDCLGAGIEVTEIALLLMVVAAARFPALSVWA